MGIFLSVLRELCASSANQAGICKMVGESNNILDVDNDYSRNIYREFDDLLFQKKSFPEYLLGPASFLIFPSIIIEESKASFIMENNVRWMNSALHVLLRNLLIATYDVLGVDMGSSELF
jgi:hypothetical protein